MMQDFTQEQIDKTLQEIEQMDHETMCRLWRFGCDDDKPYFRNDLPTAQVFVNRLFNHFGGFTPEISKRLGWTE